MEVDCYSYNYVQSGPVQGEMYCNQANLSPHGSEEYNQTNYCVTYMDPSPPIWAPAVHPYQPAMHWTQYTDINQQGLKIPTISAHSYAIARRNERERNRVRHINSTFERLRKHLPSTGRKRKLSKVDTLRTAISYIDHLQDILDSTDDPSDASKENSLLENVNQADKVKTEQNNNQTSLDCSPNISHPKQQDSKLINDSDNYLSSCRYLDNEITVENCERNNYSSVTNKPNVLLLKEEDVCEEETSSASHEDSCQDSWSDSVF